MSEETQLSLSQSTSPGGNDLFGEGAMGQLGSFLAAGAPPVYMGWGSMIAVSPEHMAILAVRSLKLANQRGIILGGFARLNPALLDGVEDAAELQKYAKEYVLFVQSAPHEWLFPKCIALVHHGGAGTTAAGMRAGTPMVITPCWADQFDYACQVARVGVGVALPQFKTVTSTMLGAALGECVNPETQERAKALSAKLFAEDGLENAAQAIKKVFEEEMATGKHSAQQASCIIERAPYRQDSGLGAKFRTLCYVTRAWAGVL